MTKHDASQAFWERAKQSLAGGVSSNVRARARPLLYFERGQGCRLIDVDGNTYLDYTIGQGPMLLGHNPEPVFDAVSRALKRGQLYAGQHELEITLSEKLQKLIPCADRVRYSNSGSEAVHAALRLARAHTGRDKIIKFEGHYHGWYDNIMVSIHPPLDRVGSREQPNTISETRGQAANAYADVIVLPWNDLDVLEDTINREADNIAAIIMEPIMCNTGCILPQAGYLEGVRELCTRHGIVLIFDEIITGFRVGLGGAQEHFNVIPDLATYGKAMANGFPVSCLAGKADLMELIADGTANHSGTYNSNVMAMAATLATVTELESNAEKLYSNLYDLGKQLMTGLTNLARRLEFGVNIQGPGPMFAVAFSEEQSIVDYRSYVTNADQDRYKEFATTLLDEGIRVLPRGLWYMSAPLTSEDVQFTLQVVEKVWAHMMQTNPL